MSNIDEYKKSVDKIHASEELKQKTFEKMNKNNNYIPLKLLSVAAVFLIVLVAGHNYYNNEDGVYVDETQTKEIEITATASDLPRFKNKQELIDILKENDMIYTRNSIMKGMAADAAVAESITDSAAKLSDLESADFSKTNNQVDNVDEADIVKTDGKNIYYTSNGIVNIIDANNLELLSEIKGYRNDDETFTPYQIFINDDKIVVIGNYNKREKITEHEEDRERVAYDYAYINYSEMAKALVYDLSNIRDPKLIREVALDGYYSNARMIGDNVYFISRKGIRYFSEEQIKDEEILPLVCDSIARTETKRIAYTDIAYFPGSNSYSYMLVGGFNINNNDPLNVETFFGAGDTVYCSENNLYLTQTVYNDNYTRNNVAIYKFELDNSKVTMKAKGEVEGYINNQFSLDEFENNLRIATTVITKPYEYNEETKTYTEEETTNRVYILNENLEEISRIDNMADGEKIYAVRFMGRIGYVVTFEQVDPLFVLDLSDPKNPQVKGELKIPGYSSYLHPYDETHVIGIGYNTKPNGYGGITNTNMKMSMFDISDLSNPTEMFNIDIGLDYAYSSILHDHKALFYKAQDNLIGFPYSTYNYNGGKDYWVFDIFHIDLEKGFERFCKFEQKHDYKTNISRMLYIGNTLYGLSEYKVTSYDLNTQELLHELELNELESEYMTIINDARIIEE